MAKRFGGFTPQQQQTLLSKMGYTGPAQQDDINKFMMSSPKAASMMGRYAQMAKARVEGGPQTAMQVGGYMAPQQLMQQAMPTLDYNRLYQQPNPAPEQPQPIEVDSLQPQSFALGGMPSGYDPNDKTTKVFDPVSGKTLTPFQLNNRMNSPNLGQAYVDAGINTNTPNTTGGFDDTTPPPAPQGVDTFTGSLDQYQQRLSTETGKLADLTNQLAGMPAPAEGEEVSAERKALEEQLQKQQTAVTQAQAGLSAAQQQYQLTQMPSTTELRGTALSQPSTMVTQQEVAKVTPSQRAAGRIAEGTGQAPDQAVKAQQTVAKLRADVPLAQEFEAAGMTTAEAAQEVANVMSKLTAVTGKPSAEALADAATMDPQQLAQLGLTVEQIDRARRVEAIPALEVTPEMEVTGVVDLERAKAETNFAAATGVPSTEATVQGQLTQLMEQFEDGETPSWAAGAMRAATAAMASRGLAASSMAGQAIVQAAMESALPIAQMDAQTRAQFEAQNLSNRQQAAMFAAEQRSKFLGMEFDQEFQARVQNAARIADVAQINFTAEQQVALENARMAQTVDIANLDAKNAKIMADAAAMSQLDLTNLNNRQQANVQRAKAFLDFDMSSMSNQQQVAMFKAQSLANVYMSDTAAENAARQFNASSEDQVGMFFSNLQTQIQQFNNEQANAMEKFNAGEANAISQFNAAQQNARDQFNASQALAVEQANTQWEQAITTMDNAAQNQANRDAAIAANGYTETTYNNMLQQERDVLDYAWRSADNALQRENALMQVQMQNDAAAAKTSGEAAGTIAAIGTRYVLNKFLGPLG
jgi:hypothetical protein